MSGRYSECYVHTLQIFAYLCYLLHIFCKPYKMSLFPINFMQTSSPVVIHVLVADNARMYTQLLADALGRDPQIRVVSAPSDSNKIKEEVTHHENLDIVILGSNLDEVQLHGIALLRELRVMRPEIKGIILLDSSKREVILEAFRAGARGLFSRHESLETLSKCVRQVQAGQIWANSEQMSYAVEALALAPNIKAVDANGLNILSKREIEVVRSLAEGLTNREIAVRLGLSQHTIKNYLFRIFDKLGVSSRMELMFLALNPNAIGKPPLEIAKDIAERSAPGPQLAGQRIHGEQDHLEENADTTLNRPRNIFKVQSV